MGSADREGSCSHSPARERKEAKKEREKGGLEAIKRGRIKQATRSASSNGGRPASGAHRLQPLSRAPGDGSYVPGPGWRAVG